MKHYQIPAILYTVKYNEQLTDSARKTYAYLSSMNGISTKNKDTFTDAEGNVFVWVTRQTAMRNVNIVSPSTITDAFKRLKNAGLIEEKKLGQGRPNRIYIKEPTISQREKDELLENLSKDKSREGKKAYKEAMRIVVNAEDEQKVAPNFAIDGEGEEPIDGQMDIIDMLDSMIKEEQTKEEPAQEEAADTKLGDLVNNRINMSRFGFVPEMLKKDLIHTACRIEENQRSLELGKEIAYITPFDDEVSMALAKILVFNENICNADDIIARLDRYIKEKKENPLQIIATLILNNLMRPERECTILINKLS